MTTAVPDILARIVERKRQDIAGLASRLQEFENKASALPHRDFPAALKAAPPAVIAEIKQASPSKGTLADHFDPAAIAALYETGGAAALSVLTDEPFFKGSLSDLESARAAVNIPVLRKDFTISRAQIAEAAASGADAVLLIAAILSDREMRDFREYAEGFGLAALVEVHDAEELERAISAGASIIGVNNRDLRTFEVRLDTSLGLAPLIPSSAIRVSESGIQTAADVALLREAGYDAFLVGEHLMRSASPAGAIRELRR